MKKGFNSFQLKCIAILLMLSGLIIQVYCKSQALAAPEQQSEGLLLLFYLGQVVYLAAFPLCAFLLVEAFKHTSDKKKLLLRLLAAGILAELPMDLATYGISKMNLWVQNQNYFFTLVIGVLVLWGIEKATEKYGQGTMKTNLLTLLVYLVATMTAIFLRTEQSSVGVLTVIALYLFYGNKMFSFVTVAALYVFFTSSTGQNMGLEYLPVLSVLFIWLYNGEQGKAGKVTRAVFYFIVPVVYGILGTAAGLL